MQKLINCFMLLMLLSSCSLASVKERVVQQKLDNNVVQVFVFKNNTLLQHGTAFFVTFQLRTFLVTNKHVCEGGDYLMINQVVTYAISTSPNSDLCIIKTGNRPGLFINAEESSITQLVYSSGFGGNSYTYKNGRVKSQTELYLKVIPGDSGSPVVNADGRVIGVISHYALDHSVYAWMVSYKALTAFLDSQLGV